MRKLRKFLKVGLPLVAASAIGIGAFTSIALTSKHTASIDKNLYEINKLAEEKGISQKLSIHLPSVANGWGRIALTPRYPDAVLQKFGAAYGPDNSTTKWPRLIANSVKAEDVYHGKVDKSDLITFEQLIPNETLAKLVASSICRVPSTSTVLEWKIDDEAPNGGFWLNHLAQFDAKWDNDQPNPQWLNDDWVAFKGEEWHLKSDWISEFVGSSIFYISSKYTGTQSTTTNPDRLLASVLMNPWLFDCEAYNYDDPDNSHFFVFEPSFSHVCRWWLDGNELSTLPRGLFQHVYLHDSDQIEDGIFTLDLENNNISNLNPLELFGKRIQPDATKGEIEDWSSRTAFGPAFKCDIHLDVSKTLINASQTSWQELAGNLTREKAYKYGWNFDGVGYNLYTWALNEDTLSKEYIQVEYLNGSLLPNVGPIPRYDDSAEPGVDPRNYGIGTTTDRISETVMYTLTNGFTKNDIWATNIVVPIIVNTNQCLAEMNWISIPLSDEFLSSGSANDLDGICDISVAESSSPIDIGITFEISGFNEATSGLILSIVLTIVFLLALMLSVLKVYRNYHPKLSKDELKIIHEVNSANRLNKIRKLAEEKEKVSKEESQQ